MTVKELIVNLASKDQVIRIHAAATLAEMGEAAAAAAPALVEMLKSENLQAQKIAAWTLGEIGPVAQVAVPLLLDLAQQDDELADLAIEALEAIDVVESQAA